VLELDPPNVDAMVGLGLIKLQSSGEAHVQDALTYFKVYDTIRYNTKRCTVQHNTPHHTAPSILLYICSKHMKLINHDHVY